MDLKEMGKEIRKKRLAKNWLQEDLAECVDLTATYISLIERGKKCPTLETFIIIANALDASADELLASAIKNGHVVRMSKYLEKMDTLNAKDQKMLCELMEVFFRDV